MMSTNGVDGATIITDIPSAKVESWGPQTVGVTGTNREWGTVSVALVFDFKS